MAQIELDALYPTAPPRSMPTTLKVSELPDDGTRAPGSLVRSVKRFGVIEPIIVADHGDDGYTVADGKRRLAAAREAGRDEIKAEVYDADDIAACFGAMSVVLNHERGPNPVTTYDAVVDLAMNRGVDVALIARATGLTVPAVKTILSLTSVHPAIIQAMRAGRVKFSVVRQVAKLSRKTQNILAQDVIETGMKLTAAVVREARERFEPQASEESGDLLAGDEIVEWSDTAAGAITSLIEGAPAGVPAGVVAGLTQAIEALRGRAA